MSLFFEFGAWNTQSERREARMCVHVKSLVGRRASVERLVVMSRGEYYAGQRRGRARACLRSTKCSEAVLCRRRARLVGKMSKAWRRSLWILSDTCTAPHHERHHGGWIIFCFHLSPDRCGAAKPLKFMRLETYLAPLTRRSRALPRCGCCCCADRS